MQSTIKKSAKHLAVPKLFTIFAVVSDKSEGRKVADGHIANVLTEGCPLKIW